MANNTPRPRRFFNPQGTSSSPDHYSPQDWFTWLPDTPSETARENPEADPDLNSESDQYSPPEKITLPDVAMSSSNKPKKEGKEGFHQEYIASLRYRNDLPPPPMPPKLLDIPHEGLARYCSPGFASNLARRTEPNIDVDAEGGMPIDLIGLPGLHLGDDSAIMMPEIPRTIDQLDPADQALMTSLADLRKPPPKTANVSFLRRPQHISVDASAPAPGSGVPAPARRRVVPRAAPIEDPKRVKKLIQKGFDIAYPENKHTGEDTAAKIRGLPATQAEIDAWANPVHPDNPKAKPVGFFPVMPDLDGFPDPGGYLQFKFDKAPVPAIGARRDKRMDVALMSPAAPMDHICQEHAQKTALFKANPKVHADPGPIPWNYNLYLPENPGHAKKIHASMDPKNPDRDNQSLYANEGDNGKFHNYERVRTYETSSQSLNTDQKQQKDYALTLHKHVEGDGKQTAAYIYPILGKTRLKPERARTIARAGLAYQSSDYKDESIVDQLQISVRDPDEMETHKRAQHRANVDPTFAKTLVPPAGLDDDNSADKAEEDDQMEE